MSGYIGRVADVQLKGNCTALIRVKLVSDLVCAERWHNNFCKCASGMSGYDSRIVQLTFVVEVEDSDATTLLQLPNAVVPSIRVNVTPVPTATAATVE